MLKAFLCQLKSKKLKTEPSHAIMTLNLAEKYSLNDQNVTESVFIIVFLNH